VSGPAHRVLNGTVATAAAANAAGVTTIAHASAAAPAILVAVLAVLLGGELPDKDQRWPLKYVVTHRGVTHRLWAHLAAAAIVYAAARHVPAAAPYAAYASLGLLAGLAAHCAGDMLTPDGLPYLSPIIRRDLYLFPFRVRSVDRGEHPRQPGAVGPNRVRHHPPYRVRYNRNGAPLSRPYRAISEELALRVACTVVLAAGAAVLYLRYAA
jgi:membrane-bound metal-dependent hydrolase YbcI (DUF457 family)